MTDYGSVRICATSHPKFINKIFQYGTAGFRDKSSELDCVMFRMGILAVLRSKATGAAIGVMITASHNPEEDNGVKLIDPHGEMLDSQWEAIATQLANVPDKDLVATIKHIVYDTLEIDMTRKASVFLGMDTRPSSTGLAKAVIDGVQSLEGAVFDYGLLTTPQLHYIVCCHNCGGAYGEPSEDGYYKKLSNAFIQANSLVEFKHHYVPCLRVDGANGVGALALGKLIPCINNILRIELFNTGADANQKLNHMCGADFVKVEQRAPLGVPIEPGYRYASFDGDGDRIVYFYINQQCEFRLLDGDKIAVLFAGYLKELVEEAGIDLEFCFVQTAYANGSSTNYIKENLRIPISCVPTGVKHLHHQAQQADIGIYFEANGHGTVLFSEKARKEIKKIIDEPSPEDGSESILASKRLLTVIDMINQTVGDAVSDLLLVETILCERGWSVENWDALYEDYPSRQMKVKVLDRNLIRTANAERTCSSPPGLQNTINTLISKYNRARAFVRPSGTEDIVRVYAEAATQKEADQLVREVAAEVYKQAGGVGPMP